MAISRRITVLGLSCVLFALGAATTIIFARHSESSGLRPEARVSESVTLPERGFYENLQIVADEVESYPSLAAMATAADAVVIGTLSSFRLHRTIPSGSPEYVVHMAAVDVTVSETVRGEVGKGPLILEFLLPGRADQVTAKIEQQRKNTPVEPVLLFLRESDQGAYRLVNSYGLWTTVEEQVTAPLVPHHDATEPRALPRRRPTLEEQAEAERELAARPPHLRVNRRAPSSPSEPAPEAAAPPPANEADRYAKELAQVRSLPELATQLRD